MECLFCKIVKEKEKLAAEKKICLVGENEGTIAILDINPISDGHTLIISKNHAENITKLRPDDWNSLFLNHKRDGPTFFQAVVNKLQETFNPQGFNFITNMGEEAYQSIFHFHLHIIPKYEKNQGFIWTSKPKLKYNLEEASKKLK